MKTHVLWHPVSYSEGEDGVLYWNNDLPMLDEPVLVTLASGEVCVDSLTEDYEGGCYFDTYTDDVIAWAYLPAPYVPSEQGAA